MATEEKRKELSKQYRKQIGENIRALREQNGYSIDELAGLMGLSSAFIGLIERGHRGAKFDNLMKLCQIFGCTLDDLANQEEYNAFQAKRPDVDPLLYDYLKKNDFGDSYKAKQLLLMLEAGAGAFGIGSLNNGN